MLTSERGGPASAGAPVASSESDPARADLGQPAATDPSLPQAAPVVAEDDEPIHAPGAEDLRKDVAKDPHSTPAALIEFAEKLAPKMEAAETSVEKAREFFGELEECVMDQPQTGAKPVQALCLANAAELAEIHPELKGTYEALSKNAPPAVVQLLEAAESID
jgi:hypothetical protein